MADPCKMSLLCLVLTSQTSKQNTKKVKIKTVKKIFDSINRNKLQISNLFIIQERTTKIPHYKFSVSKYPEFLGELHQIS